LRLLPGRVDAGNTTKPDGIEDRGGDRWGEAGLVTAALEDPLTECVITGYTDCLELHFRKLLNASIFASWANGIWKT